MRYSPDVRIIEVGVGHLGVVEVAADRLLVDLVGLDALGHQGPHRVDDLGPAAVVEGDGERHAPVVPGQLDRLVHAPRAAAWAPASRAGRRSGCARRARCSSSRRRVEDATR